MKKVLAFFGAFNPPTRAHVELAEFAMKKTNSEEVIFVPSKSTYIIREQKKSFAFEDDERLRMLGNLANSYPWLAVSNHDIMAETQPRSYETLCWLRDKFSIHPKLLVGMDQFQQMETSWAHVPEIAKEFGIVVLTRPYLSIDSCFETDSFYQNLAPYVTEIEAPSAYKGISSTDVRTRIQEAQTRIYSIRNMVPPEVFHFIKENYL